MNFYSDIILNDTIDNEVIEKFIEESFSTIAKYSLHDIQHKYIYNVLTNTKNIITFFCLDNDITSFSISNCPSILVYHKYTTNTTKTNELQSQNEIRYYVLVACTKRKFRNQGYATKLLDGLVERIKKENSGQICKISKTTPHTTIKIILSSLEESVLFYESYGFKWTTDSITDHPILMDYEKHNEEKEYFIMELVLV
jgi:ribosomal protein S18 acetylase RimI-like enzyme